MQEPESDHQELEENNPAAGSSSDENVFHTRDSTESTDDSDNEVAAQKLSAAFVYTQVTSFTTHCAAKAFYNTAFKQRYRIRKLVNDRWSWNSYKVARSRIEKHLPKIQLYHYFKSKGDGTEKLVISASLPEKKWLQDNEYDHVATWSRIKIADALAAYDKLHGKRRTKGIPAKTWKNAGSPPVEIVLSMDGVPLDHSSSLTMEIVSIKLRDCNQILPIGVHIGTSKEKNLDRIFDPIIEELASLNVKITSIIADSPQRVTLLNMDAVTAYFGCSKCYARGEANQEKREKGDRKGPAVVWPIETLWQLKRTMTSWLEDIEASKFAKQHGIKGDTPLRKLVQDLNQDVPLDTFHVLYLGLVKRLLKQLLKIKDAGPTGIMKEVKAKIDTDLKDTKCIQYPSDVSRHPRPINLAVYKSSELRNLATAAFYILTEAFEYYHQPAASKLWGYFIYLVKAFLLPNELYIQLESSCNLKAIMNTFYRLYIKVCKKRTCAPNVHMFHHLLEARSTEEFSQMSTEPFESAYAVLKRCYQPGTKSQGKQMLQRLYTLLLAQEDKHSCSRKIRIRPKTKAKYNDSLIATKEHLFYRVEGKLASGNYACKRLVICRFEYPHAPSLNFQKLWTHRLLGELPTLREISPSNVMGKVVLCRDVLTLLPVGALFG